MDDNQLKLKIDYLILKCDILENDIFTDSDSYYKWIYVKVQAKIAQMTLKNNLNIGFFSTVLAVAAMLVSLVSFVNSFYEIVVSKDFIVSIIVSIFILLMIFIVVFTVWVLDKLTSKKRIKKMDRLYDLKEFLEQYLKLNK